MIVFTWNIAKNTKALRLALTYISRLAASDSVLACLQELPDPKPPDLEPSALSAIGLAAEVPPLSDKRVLFVHSATITRLNAWNEAEDRMQIVHWQLGTGTQFVAAGVHMIDRRNHATAEVRGAYASLTRLALDSRWPPNIPLLVIGDFNAWPELPELENRACFFGVSQKYEHQARHDTFFGRQSPPLFRIEPTGISQGTYFDPNGSIWRDIDHIYVSRTLRAGASAQRRIALGQEQLITRSGRPANKLSDHLPVEAQITLS